MRESDGGDPRELAQRLREARRAAGLTQAAVADELGTARTTLVAIEQGERRVSAPELIRLAAIYGRPLSELLRAAPPVPGLAPQFRSAIRATQAAGDGATELEQATAELRRWAEDYAALEAMLGARIKNPAQPEYDAGGTDAERAGAAAAAAERNRLGMGDGPVGSLRKRLEGEVGLRVFYFRMASRVAGLFAYSPAMGGLVGINDSHPPERRNWTLAHEWGHFVLSRHQAEITVLTRGGRSARREILADSFAQNVLMPADGLSRRFTEMNRAAERGVTLADVCGLASLYAVSVQAMVLRLEGIGRLAKGTWEHLQAEGFKPGRAQQMLGLAREPPRESQYPARYGRLAALAFAKGLLSEGQLARYLRTDRVTARALVEALAGGVQAEVEGEFKPVAADLAQPLRAR